MAASSSPEEGDAGLRGAVHVNLGCQRGFSHLGCMEEWIFKENWFKGECYFIVYRCLYSGMMYKSCYIFHISLKMILQRCDKFHDLLAFKYHKPV